MKLFVAAICLLCCGNAFGQDKPIPKGEMSCVNEATGEVWSRLPSGHCYPKPVDMSNHQARKKQLICDWNGKGWFCPTREPISNLDGKMVPDAVTLSGSVSGENFIFCCKSQDFSAPPFDVPAIPAVIEHNILKSGWTCAEKERFLLYSADGKAHCLRLLP